jgi:fructokinase
VTFGGIEAGGTKWVCAVGTGPDDLRAVVTFPTTGPDETIGRAAAFFAEHDDLEALGVGSFGPVDLRPGSPTRGHITTTPKPGWANVDLAGMLERALGLPPALDTDVNAAAIGEHRWGAGRGLDTFVYLTVGTGIGGGCIVHGRVVHGLFHPELGHMRVPHDRDADPFDGCCPYHGDCLEGLASGEAIRRRWGSRGEELHDPAAWELVAGYLAAGLANVVAVLSPQRLVVGGGVAQQPPLLPLVRTRLAELLGGYVPPAGDDLDAVVVRPALGGHAGVLGALELARRAIGLERAADLGHDQLEAAAARSPMTDSTTDVGSAS